MTRYLASAAGEHEGDNWLDYLEPVARKTMGSILSVHSMLFAAQITEECYSITPWLAARLVVGLCDKLCLSISLV